ncbi:radial spoke head protein 6 homolog A [Anabrus simplex]|uniref:radial spoke head protein 6 homolog A n=1 Tax=Anabrus simplex TaxID=316456 RepID=UPI0035A27ECF
MSSSSKESVPEGNEPRINEGQQQGEHEEAYRYRYRDVFARYSDQYMFPYGYQFGEGYSPDRRELDFTIPEEEEESDISLEHDMLSAKAFLKQTTRKDGISLFDHLSELLAKILAERPRNILEFFEEHSRKLKETRFRDKTEHLLDLYVPPERYERAKEIMSLFEVTPTSPEQLGEAAEEDDEEEGEEIAQTPPNVMELLFYFEQADVGLPREEMFLIALALNDLRKNSPVKNYRFWGKILGLEKNYIIAETELTLQEFTRRTEILSPLLDHLWPYSIFTWPLIPLNLFDLGPDIGMGGNLNQLWLGSGTQTICQEEEVGEGQVEGEEKEEEQIAVQELTEEEKEAEEEMIGEGAEMPPPPPKKPPPFPPIPQSDYKKPPQAPTEKLGQGTNKKVFFVCNQPGEKWVELPEVTPEQIVVARKIKIYFTGNLTAPIQSYPPFPGTEMEYLRAQIARISAGTQVSPLGFYHFDEEEEEVEEEEEQQRTNYIENPEFEPVPLRDLLDGNFPFWVHHTQHILKQGRTAWWNPKKGLQKEDEEEEEEEEPEEEQTDVKPEIGPPLLTPLSEDTSMEATPPWTVQSSSKTLTDFAVAVLRSNLWPGAIAFASGRKFDNVYIGWGHKISLNNFSPEPMEAIQSEYPQGPEIMEIDDPTPEEEEAWRLAHEKKPPPPDEEEEEEQEEEEEEGEEDEEDDED